MSDASPALQAIWYARQIRGARPYQEDLFAIVQGDYAYIGQERFSLGGAGLPAHHSLYLLADGMGGMGHGDIAARAVVDAFIEHYLLAQAEGRPVGECLQDALEMANRHVRDCVEREPTYRGMGCTLIALLFDSDLWRSHWVSVGDSPLWMFRRNRLQRLNVSHTWRRRLSVDPCALAPFDPQSNPELLSALSSAVDGGRLHEIELQEGFAVDPGDLLLIASDGVESLSLEDLTALVREHLEQDRGDIQQCLEDLSASVLNSLGRLRRSDQDNASLILLAAYPRRASEDLP